MCEKPKKASAPSPKGPTAATPTDEAAIANGGRRSAYASASFLSKLFFAWPYHLLKLGLERPLEAADLPNILEADSSRACGKYLWALWTEEHKNARRTNPDWKRPY